ncbi:hypothetical protein [Rothia nasisuis]|uniref:hypothetical protein n=1 Tax=Rothia nasisuis TaxID=2109647 RepID=UPI001F1B88F6|nr:hypothetical protein [Rothia nasisuis]
MFDWFFAAETSRVILTTLIGSAAAIYSAFIASRNVSKTIRNQNKGLPPELLRLEKIQQIIVNHNSDEFLREIDVTGLRDEYKKAIHRSILESKIGNLGIQDQYARKKLLEIPEKTADNSTFPNLNNIHGGKIDRLAKLSGILLMILGTLVLILSVIILTFVIGYLAMQFMDGSGIEVNETLGVILTSIGVLIIGITIIFMGSSIVNRRGVLDIETDLIVRNVYQHYSMYFTGSTSVVVENESEIKKRVIFENSKKYRNWSILNPDKSSWDYGFNSESPLSAEEIRIATPKGYTVVTNKFLFTMFPFMFKCRGRKVVRNKSNQTQRCESLSTIGTGTP